MRNYGEHTNKLCASARRRDILIACRRPRRSRQTLHVPCQTQNLSQSSIPREFAQLSAWGVSHTDDGTSQPSRGVLRSSFCRSVHLLSDSRTTTQGKRATGLFAYEYAITFGREINLFWRRKVTVSSILFLVNRYVPLVVNMIYAPWPSYPTTHYVSNVESLPLHVTYTSSSGVRSVVNSSRLIIQLTS